MGSRPRSSSSRAHRPASASAAARTAAGCADGSINVEHIKPDGAHATSTCWMSNSDADGVVDQDLRVHGTDNLFICSNAVFPNVTAVNLTLTLGALAARLA